METFTPTIKVQDLTYQFPDSSFGLKNVTFQLPVCSRTLLIGANGSGKSTLLRLMSGRRMSPPDTIAISGLDPFVHSLSSEVIYLGLEWTLNPVVRSDISVPVLLSSVGGDAYPDRRDELVSILDVDLTWHLHAVSDGERRRVQLCMGLLQPWKVLLLDELTVDLDVLSRHNFLSWLKRETQVRKCTIVYATHVLDGLGDWATHLVHMAGGLVKKHGTMEEIGICHWTQESSDRQFTQSDNSRLGDLVLEWLREDLKERGPRKGQANEGKSYECVEGRGGYGFETRLKPT